MGTGSRKLYILVGAALITSLALSLFWRPLSFEERIIRIQAEEASPELAAALEAEPLEVQAVVLDYADDRVLQLKAQAALLKYPELARRILPVYGADERFRHILKAYGESIFPPIEYFRTHSVSTVEAMHYAWKKWNAAKTAVAKLRAPAGRQAAAAPKRGGTESIAAPNAGSTTPGGEPAERPATPEQAALADAEQALTPEERGWYAVGFIANEGHDFLGQFVLDQEGSPQWIQSERFLEGVSLLFASGVRDLEARARTDQEIRAGDLGWAAVDVFAVVGALKLLRLGKAAAASGKSVSMATRSAAYTSRLARAGRFGASVAKYGKWPAIALVGYTVVKHPGIIHDTLSEVSKAMGLPAWVGPFVGWALILLPLYYLFSWTARWAVRPTIALLRRVVDLLSRLERRGKKPKPGAPAGDAGLLSPTPAG